METLLVVDDDPNVRNLIIKWINKKGFTCLSAVNGQEALNILLQNEVDLVLSDIRMPIMDGIQLLKSALQHYPDLAVVLLTGYGEIEVAVDAMKSGAYDFLSKPIDLNILGISLDRALERRRMRLEIKHYQQNLERLVAERTRELQQVLDRLKETNLETVRALSEGIEAKDPYTRGHCHRVSFWALEWAREVGFSEEQLEYLEYGSLLHDTGKIGVQDQVLNKPGPLTAEEYEHLKEHPKIGYRMIKSVRALAPALPIIRHHHERYDGKGYPDGIKGLEIPLDARIVVITDAFDAMTSTRPYRGALSVE
ncbi:MAG: response regulator, partial [Deltaproteobacteria bacterium]|nr:response regulator [Deltaproteobacteria bacterium]